MRGAGVKGVSPAERGLSVARTLDAGEHTRTLLARRCRPQPSHHVVATGYVDDDWQGADFLAYHKDGSTTLKVQLKARATIGKKYQGKDLYLAFPVAGHWYLLPHDDLVRIACETTPWLQSQSWLDDGLYSSAKPSKLMLDRLSAHALKPNFKAVSP